MNLESTTQLLEDFKKIPINFKDSTYLELCQYPKRRFEEICSRLLAFYFDPAKEHGFGDLFINSLLELLKCEIQFDASQLQIITEDNAEGKRIDLVISCPDFIIGIENKITAGLYNPLEAYKKRLEAYSRNEVFKLVLSVYDVTKPEELKLINNNDFQAITYTQLFKRIKVNIGSYISTCNQKYLTHLYDFIDTIENMNTTDTNKALNDFIFDNEKGIKELIKAYNHYNQDLLSRHKDRIKEIQECIGGETGVKWWIWQGWDLGISKFHGRDTRFGIEASFEAGKNDPYEKFRIYITSWTLSDFAPYRKRLQALFPGNVPDDRGIKDRVYLHMEPIDGNNTDEIVKKLKDYYEIVVELTRDQQLDSQLN